MKSREFWIGSEYLLGIEQRGAAQELLLRPRSRLVIVVGVLASFRGEGLRGVGGGMSCLGKENCALRKMGRGRDMKGVKT